MKITPIKNEAELDRALARVDELIDPDEPGTPEADQLAMVNNVGLVDGGRLREMLLQYLKENWS